jgi:hypothetical protein
MCFILPEGTKRKDDGQKVGLAFVKPGISPGTQCRQNGKERKRVYTIRALPLWLTPNICLQPNHKKTKEAFS